MPLAHTRFETALGPVTLAWSPAGIRAVVPPGGDALPSLLRPSSSRPAKPPPAIQKVVARLTRALDGEPHDFRGVPVDTSGFEPFDRRVYDVTQRVPRGELTTCTEVAKVIGGSGGTLSVARALARNPLPLIVPCHRVLPREGSLRGFTPVGGLSLKRALLALEGIDVGVRPRGLAFDPALAVRLLAKADPALGRMMARIGPCGLAPQMLHSPFEALARAIVYQQLTGRAAGTIHGRLLGLFGGGALRPEDIVSASDERLRSAGLSRAKVLALRDLSEKALAGRVPDVAALRDMSDDEIVDALTDIRGIGRWTVEMMLIFRLGRPDVLPVDDYGVRKGFARLRRMKALPAPKELLAFGERWRPFRTVASWYLWRIAELAAR